MRYNIAGFQCDHLGAAGKSERQLAPNRPIVHARAQPAGDIVLVQVCQQMLGQDLPKIIAEAGKIDGEILGDGSVAGIQAQQPLKILLALGAHQGYGQGRVPQLHIE